MPPYLTLAADDSSQVSGYYQAVRQKTTLSVHKAASPTSLNNHKSPMLSKEMWKEISGSKSQNLGIKHNKTNSRNIDLAIREQSWIGKSANLPTTH